MQVIEIDSDDEGVLVTRARAAAAAGRNAVEPASFLTCSFAHFTDGGNGARRPVRLGVVSVSLSQDGRPGGSVARDAELEIMREDSSGKGACIRVPVVTIMHFDMQTRQGEIVVLGLSSPIDVSVLRQQNQTAALVIDEFMLVFLPSTVPVALATIRSWLPHLTEHRGSMDQAPRRTAEVAALSLDGIMLTARDIRLLGDHRCLNDTCLDFFARLAMELVAPEDLRSKIWVASTFFFQKLTSGGVTSGEDGWKNVCRWAKFREGGVLRRRYIFLPINVQNKHWWLAVICNPSNAFDQKSEGAPRMVFLDSGAESQATTTAGKAGAEPLAKMTAAGFLRGYIWREWHEREDQDTSAFASTAFADSLKTVVADVPKQANNYDCGIFIIEFIVHLFQSPSALLSLGLAPHRHWFRQDVVSHRRTRLRWVAAMLQSEAKKRADPDVGRLLQDVRLKRTLSAAFIDKPVARSPKKAKLVQ